MKKLLALVFSLVLLGTQLTVVRAEEFTVEDFAEISAAQHSLAEDVVSELLKNENGEFFIYDDSLEAVPLDVAKTFKQYSFSFDGERSFFEEYNNSGVIDYLKNHCVEDTSMQRYIYYTEDKFQELLVLTEDVLELKKGIYFAPVASPEEIIAGVVQTINQSDITEIYDACLMTMSWQTERGTLKEKTSIYCSGAYVNTDKGEMIMVQNEGNTGELLELNRFYPVDEFFAIAASTYDEKENPLITGESEKNEEENKQEGLEPEDAATGDEQEKDKPEENYGFLYDNSCDWMTADDLKTLDYSYRWSVDAELDNTYKGTWLYAISDNGKIRISFIRLREALFPDGSGRMGNDVLLFEGKTDAALVCRTGNGKAYQTVQRRIYYSESGYGSAEIDELCGDFHLRMFKDANNEGKVLFFVMGLGYSESKGIFDTTPVVMDSETVCKAEDTDLVWTQRTVYRNLIPGTIYPEGFSRTGKIIKAKAIVSEAAKRPIVTDAIFEEEYLNEYVGLFDITVDEMVNSELNNWVGKESSESDKKLVIYLLNGRCHEQYYKSFEDGRMLFELDVPQEYVKEISSTGKISVSMQRYDVYYNSLPDKNLIFKKDVMAYNGSVKVYTLSGDLGKKQYVYQNTSHDKFEENGKYYSETFLMPVFAMDNEAVVGIIKELNSAAIRNDEVWKIPDAPWLYCEFEDSEFTKIKKIGLKFDNTLYTKALDEIQIDFDVEVDFCDRVVYTTAARSIVSASRGLRTKNNEMENVLSKNDILKPLKKSDVGITMDGKLLEFEDQEPVIVNERVLIPLRAVFEELGAMVEWDGVNKTVTMVKDDITVRLQIGKPEIVKNGVSVEIDTASQIQNSRTLVPIRAVSESFGNTVIWDENNRIVEIK